MLSYSIAIRTLGTAGDKFRQELESINGQTFQPEKVIVYIAEGYPRPGFQIGKEEYVWVKKGMVAQRALSYSEINSDYILFLDDDVFLSPDIAERVLILMEQNHLDCLGVDVFCNHKMPPIKKIHYIISNLTFPVFSKKWGYKVRLAGSLNYNNSPISDFYITQKCDGPCMMIKKNAFLDIKFQDELWLDDLGFAYGEDTVLSHKLFKNNFRIGMLYNASCKHLDGATDSLSYKQNAYRLAIRSKANTLFWFRAIYQPLKSNPAKRLLAVSLFIFKNLWLLIPVSGFSIVKLNIYPIKNHIKGIVEAFKMIKSEPFKSLPPFIEKDGY